jgi:arabinosaccharide transport system substrate-binding protein
VAQTVAFYAQCAVGPGKIGSETGEGDGPLTRDLLEGNLCAFLTADWRMGLLKQFGGSAMKGKLRFMQLPRFDPADAPTASWGGTMIGILRSSKHKQEAWKLIEHLYFDRACVEARRSITQILPPVKTFWSDPSYHRPDDYFGGQYLDEKLIELAGQIPPRYATPATNLASFYLIQVLNKATKHVEEHGSAGLEAACQHWLDEAAADLAGRMKQWEFEEKATTQTPGAP